jgi:archaellum component FlaF (FlaF/FlaG flagellin family)
MGFSQPRIFSCFVIWLIVFFFAIFSTYSFSSSFDNVYNAYQTVVSSSKLYVVDLSKVVKDSSISFNSTLYPTYNPDGSNTYNPANCMVGSTLMGWSYYPEDSLILVKDLSVYTPPFSLTK